MERGSIYGGADAGYAADSLAELLGNGEGVAFGPAFVTADELPAGTKAFTCKRG